MNVRCLGRRVGKDEVDLQCVCRDKKNDLLKLNLREEIKKITIIKIIMNLRINHFKKILITLQ